MTNQNQQNENECVGKYLSSQKATVSPSAAAPAPADGLTVEREQDKSLNADVSTDGMAVSVTRHALTPLVEEFEFLLCGIDTIDLGLYVIWGPGWKRRLHNLDKKKQLARKKDGLLIPMPSGRICNFRPNGKGENYRYHLQFEAYNLYIGIAARPETSPNVYLSINAKTIWLQGIETALSWVAEDLKTIGGGSIQRVQASRVDLCCDFMIPDGLSYEFLHSHKATHNRKGKLFWGEDDEVETYYVGVKGAPIQLRIYNKGIEVNLKGGAKLWFLELWQRESTDNIWRVEFQLRRPALKEFGINSLDDLKEKKAGVWCNLTSKCFSLRLPDNEKTERRTIHPFWCAVQECFQQNGPAKEVKRLRKSAVAVSPEWHLSHINGCLSSFAAFLGITNRYDALRELQIRLDRSKNAKDFEDDCNKKAIQRGTLSREGDE